MADKYFRLVTLVVDICTPVLFELFLECVKTDTKTVPVFTTLEAYMLARKQALNGMKATGKIRKDQYEKIFPTSGQLDETSWDVSFLSALLTGLFGQTLSPVKQHIIVIREVRNSLQHKAAVAKVSHTEFDSMWSDLKLATCALANRAKGQTFEKEIEDKVDSTMSSYMSGLGDTFRHWYMSHYEEKAEQQCEKLDNLQRLTEEQTQKLDSQTQKLDSQTQRLDSQTTEIKELRAQLDIVQRDGNTACTILERVTVKRPAASASGKPNKRIQTVDHRIDRFRGQFKLLINEELPKDFNPPPEYGDVRRKLQDNHRVIVAGNGKCSYLQTALYAIKDLDYELDRCAFVTQASDWNHIEPGEIDLVLFRNPFGETDLDRQRAKALVDIFSSIMYSTKAEERVERIDVVIVTKSEVLQKMVEHIPNSRAVLEDVATVYNETSIDNPADLVTDVLDTETLQQPLQNLLDMTSTYLCKVPTAMCDSDVLKNAREKLHTHKTVVLTGSSKIGIQYMLHELSRSYEQGRCLLLTNAEDLRYVQLNKVLLLIVQDLADSSALHDDTLKWMKSFDIIRALVDADKLKVIVTATEEGMKACIEKYERHPLLEHHILVPEPDWNRTVKQEMLSDQISGLQPGANICAVACSSGENSGQTVSVLNERSEPPKHASTTKYSTTMTFAQTPPVYRHTLIYSRNIKTGVQNIMYSAVLSESFLMLFYMDYEPRIAGREPTLSTFSLAEGKIISSVGLTLSANGMTTVSRGCVAVAVSYRPCIQLVNVNYTGKLSFCLQIQTEAFCKSIAYSNGTLIGLYDTHPNTIQIRDMTGTVMKSVACDYSSHSLSVCPDNKFIYVSGSTHFIVMTMGGEVQTVIEHNSLSQELINIAIGDDGTLYGLDRSGKNICQMNPTYAAVSVIAEVDGFGSADLFNCIATFRDKLYQGTYDSDMIREYDIVKGL